MKLITLTTQQKPNLLPVILSGGAGSRLWPVSREGHPKPFMKLADGETLIQKTYKRAGSLASAIKHAKTSQVLTVTNRDYYFISKDELIKSGVNGLFLLEPVGRNTAAAIALAAHQAIKQYGQDVVILVLAADHLILDEKSFEIAVNEALSLASQNFLVTFGIEPTSPNTGFGYIECGEKIGKAQKVNRFVEKPSLEKATTYLDSGRYLWNSGMFCFKASNLLSELALHAPDISGAVSNCWSEIQACEERGGMIEIPADPFDLIPSISIDHALMEKAKNVVVVPANMGWSDIGSWDAIAALVKPDDKNNRAIGEAIFVDSSNTFIQSEDRLVAAVGVNNLTIVDTVDALLVVNSDATQDVKKAVALLKASGHDAIKLHRTILRPWGAYTILEEGPGFKVKRIEVKPGASLSLQMHKSRSEHWIVVSGLALIVNGSQQMKLATNESTYIPAGNKHRLSNIGDDILVMIEVQSGAYLGEDDIVRYDDQYGRT